MRATFGLGLLLSVSACLVDEADAWIPTEVDVEATLDRVGERSFELVCDAFEGSVHRMYREPLLIKAACTAHALQQARDAEECAVLADQCLDTLPPVVDQQLENVFEQVGCRGFELRREGCQSTVSELITCLGDLGDTVNGVRLEATCAVFGSPVPTEWWRIAPPVSCVDLFARCGGPSPARR